MKKQGLILLFACWGVFAMGQNTLDQVYLGGEGDGYASMTMVLSDAPTVEAGATLFPSQLAVGDPLGIRVTGIRTKVEIEIFDLEGRQLLHDLRWPDTEFLVLEFDTEGWPATALLVRVVVDGNVFTRKVVLR